MSAGKITSKTGGLPPTATSVLSPHLDPAAFALLRTGIRIPTNSQPVGHCHQMNWAATPSELDTAASQLDT